MNKLLIAVGLTLCVACQPILEEKKEDRLLATVFDKQLYASDVEGMIPNGVSAEDSLRITQRYVNRWIGEALMLHEAERNLPPDWNIERLVEDYRASLIRHNYEQVLVEESLDSLISEKELSDFYERNKAQYELEKPIVRCYLVKISREEEQPTELRDWWENCNTDSLSYQKLMAFCTENADAYILEDSLWYTIDELAFGLPKDALSEENIRTKREFTQRDDQYDYFYKSFEVVETKQTAPFSYIEDQARRFILKERKQETIDRAKKRMYEEALSSGDIQRKIVEE